MQIHATENSKESEILNINFHRSHPAKMEQKHKDKLREFVARSGGSKGEGLLAEMNKLMEYLFEHNLAYRTTVRCSVVGVHPQNRDGMGVSCHHVGELIKSIHSLGFDPSKVNMLLVEMLPGTKETEAAIKFNERMTMASNGRLPSVECGGPLRYCTIQGSHTNMACRSLFYGAASDDAALTDSAGNLEMSRIGAQWQAAIKSGMECTVLTSAVATTNPEIISLLQASGNAVQQISKEEDEIQVSNRIIQAIHSYQSLHGKPPLWSDISNHVLRSQPKCKEAAPSIFLFSLKYSAGDAFWTETESYIRAHGLSRSLGLETWTNLSTDLKGDARVWYRHMLLKFAFCNAERVLSASDVAST